MTCSYILPKADALYYAHIARLAYLQPHMLREDRTYLENSIPHFIDNDECQALTFFNKKRNQLIIAFRGSDSAKDLCRIFKVSLVPFVIDDIIYGRVHHGFLEYYRILQKPVFRFISRYLEPKEKPSELCVIDEKEVKRRKLRELSVRYNTFRRYIDTCSSNAPEIVFIGHSLGSCCMLAALDVARMFPHAVVKCFTYGSPKIGDKRFVKNFNKFVPFNIRYALHLDTITKLPHSHTFSHSPNVQYFGHKPSPISCFWYCIWQTCNGNCTVTCQEHHNIMAYIDAIDAIEEKKE